MLLTFIDYYSQIVGLPPKNSFPNYKNEKKQLFMFEIRFEIEFEERSLSYNYING